MNYRGKVLNHYAHWKVDKTNKQEKTFERIKAKLTVLDEKEKIKLIVLNSYRNLNTQENTLKDCLNHFNIFSNIHEPGYIEFTAFKSLNITEEEWDEDKKTYRGHSYSALQITGEYLDVSYLEIELISFIKEEFNIYNNSTLKLELNV
jgi:hypothetical protein